jgi:hypothetical protein
LVRAAQLALLSASLVLTGTVAAAQLPRRDVARVASPGQDTLRRARGDSARADSGGPTLLGQRSDLAISLLTRIEAKAERTRNERCLANQVLSVGFSCRSLLTPTLDVNFALKTTGGFADRVQVDVDYDTQREFDGSNAISIAYDGRPKDWLQHVEVGNVTFTPPPSRFITANIPSGNFGVQASARFGSLRLTAIAAQQRGNVVQDQVFTLGAQTSQAVEREIEDYQIEPRRFFFSVDPLLFGAAYPNIDLLNANQMRTLSAALPDTIRPRRLFVYRLILGGQPANPNGPRFRLNGDPRSRSGQVYELLREHVDYYVDPSLLWIALVRPLALNNERLVVAYTLRVNGRDTTIAHIGGTPDLEAEPGKEQFANLLWDPQVTPDDPAFRREIRSVYRLGGDDVRRETVEVRIAAGGSADQEKPPGGTAATYLELFGLSQLANPAIFDGPNRVWPRPDDPNLLVSATPGARIFRDQFIIFPSLEPFSRRGLARPPAVIANDTIYRTPSEYIYSPQHPQSFYRLRVRYDVTSGGAAGTISLNSVQIRQGSERLTMDGQPLTRGIDYDLGRVVLLRPDTLVARPRRVVIQYEENPLFAAIPTSIVGLSSIWTLPSGRVSLMALSQSQRTTLTRPRLGFEPQATTVAGISADFGWRLPGLSTVLGGLPWTGRDGAAPTPAAPARLDVKAEFAVSQPRQRGLQQAYIETFDGEGGTNVNLLDAQWEFSSQPALGTALRNRLGPALFDTTRASTLAFQNTGLGNTGRRIQFTFPDIDPQTALAGVGFSPTERILWLTLYPLGVGGLYDQARQRYRWLTDRSIAGRRWRSIRTVFGQAGSGIDLTRGEVLEFWTLVDMNAGNRQRNPTLVFDFGDVSENTVAFAPESLTVTAADSIFRGKQVVGFDRLDSERDAFSRAFNADVNDLGLAGDVADSLVVTTAGIREVVRPYPICALGFGREFPLGDARANCTARNARLDEEDIDQDNTLNYASSERELERVRRFIVDLSDQRTWTRVGKCNVPVPDVNHSFAAGAKLCWVQVRVPFTAPDDSTGGGPLLRRVKALRVSIVSGATLPDDQFTMAPLVRLRVIAAPWLKRAGRPLHGLAGTDPALLGTVIATTIGTQDRDSTRGIFYDPPAGVEDAPDEAQANLGVQQVQVNESSLRLLVTQLGVSDRAEAYYRFPEGQRSLMGYRELRVWARGRGRGWGPLGDLQFFLKAGRDADNFYLHRTPISSGNSRAAWEPEIRVSFDKFFQLRARLQNAFLAGNRGGLGCTGVDSLLIVRSGVPPGARIDRYAACEDGYIVYTIDPAVTPPNLAAVQELAVGMVRVDSLSGSSPPAPGDTLELWVDDIRLAHVVNTTGYAGELSATLRAGDFANLRVGIRRRDPNFRQLGEAPSFLTNDDLELSTTWRLDRFLPPGIGLVLPLTVIHHASGAAPEFLTRSDIAGDAVPGLRAPHDDNTTWSIRAQRATALDNHWWAPVANGLVLDGVVNSLGSRTEYQNGKLTDVNVALDYSSATFPGLRPSPDDASGPPIGGGPPDAPAWRDRLRPTLVRLTNVLVQSTDNRTAYLKPAAALDDSAQAVRGREEVWRSVGSVEFRPLRDVTARWDAVTVHDLRDYGDSTPTAIAASSERSTLAGVNVGLERERRMTTTLAWSPQLSGWLRPRVVLGSTYAMLRDPNNRAVGDNTSGAGGTFILPRRLGSTQQLAAATTVDPVRAIGGLLGDSARVRWLAGIVRPVDVSVTRNQLSSYDAADRTPGAGFQLGLGGIDAFRSIAGLLASSAGASTEMVVSNTLTIPGGLSISNRLQRTNARNWSRRQDDGLTVLNGDQRTWPDISLRWSGRPWALSGIFASVGATARALVTQQSWVAPSEFADGNDEVRASHATSYPLSASAVTAWGNIALSGSWARTSRVDSLPGSVGEATSSDLSADVSRAFALPAQWNLKRPLRTRASYQESLTRSFVSNDAAFGARSRLTDNGRRAFSVNADTDVAENMNFSLQGSRVVTFDRNFNRRFVQTVFSAVFQLQFFGGATR